MSSDILRIEVSARVELDPELPRGRWGEYRPNHNLGGPRNTDFVMGFLLIPEERKLEPGEPQEIVITFFVPPPYLDELRPGRTWAIHEGSKIVGTGEIIQVRSVNNQ